MWAYSRISPIVKRSWYNMIVAIRKIILKGILVNAKNKEVNDCLSPEVKK